MYPSDQAHVFDCDVVDSAGGWDEAGWSRYRDVYTRMVELGIRPVVVLYAPPRGSNGDPNWAAPGCAGGFSSIHDRTHDARWQAYTLRGQLQGAEGRTWTVNSTFRTGP